MARNPHHRHRIAARVARGLLLGLSLVLVLPFASAGAQESGGIGIALVDVPSDRADDPRARRAIVDHLAPGTTITRRVRVENTGGGPTTAELYAGAAAITDGSWSPLDGRAANELTSWIDVGTTSLQLAPHETVLVPVTLTVPVDATDGERYAVVWAELPAVTSNGFTVINRVGVRLYVSVGGGPEPTTAFEPAESGPTTAADGTRSVCVTVANTGGRAIDLTGAAELADEERTVGPYGLAGAPVVAPGETISPCATFPAETEAGPWTATVTLEGGGQTEELVFPVTFPAPDPELVVAAPVTAPRPAADGGGIQIAAPPPAETSDHAFVTLLAGVLAAGVGAAAIAARRELRKRAPRR